MAELDGTVQLKSANGGAKMFWGFGSRVNGVGVMGPGLMVLGCWVEGSGVLDSRFWGFGFRKVHSKTVPTWQHVNGILMESCMTLYEW
jgi:hypothetical protein